MRWVVDNRYSVLRELGSGGVGEVFLARDEVLGREVAVKVLGRRCAGEEGFVERFRREARSAASLPHPNIVAVHDFGETRREPEGDAVPYMTMEHVPGVTLSGLIRERGALPPRVAVAVALGAARGLGEAHRRGLIHRDVKPANVLLADPSGRAWMARPNAPETVKVTDFGIARRLAGNLGEETLTEENAVVGTAHYLSPEQATGRPVGPASDLYSLGVVLYEMLTGRRPFDASATESPLALAMKHATETPRPPEDVNPRVPQDLNALTLRLLAKEPDERLESAAGLAEELEKIAKDLEAREAPDPPPTAFAVRRPEREGETGGVETSRHPARRTLDRRLVSVTLPALVVLAVLAVVWTDERPAAENAGSPGAAFVSDDARTGAETGADRADGASPERTETTQGSPGGAPGSSDREPQGSRDGGPDGVTGTEVAVRRAAVEYYEAVDRESWAYTHANLDSMSRAMFTEREWYQKNQWFADNENLYLSSMKVDVTEMSGTRAEVDVRRTFENGDSIDRSTVFVFEDGSWKHRLVGNELIFFMPDATYEEFVAAQFAEAR